MIADRHSISLDKSPAKFICPQCGHKRFVKFRDHSTGEYIPENYGRCDRENSCGYFESPKKTTTTFAKCKSLYRGLHFAKHERPITYIPESLVNRSMDLYEKNYLFHYLKSLFTSEVATELLKKYKVGTSKNWEGATALWQIDFNGKPKQCKIMLFNPDTGKRVKTDEPPLMGESKILFAGKRLCKQYLSESNPNLKQCFFGEHLLSKSPKKVIALVESERTAMVMSLYYPEYIWLATGGKAGCAWYKADVAQPLKGRKVVLFPDTNCYDNWKEKSNHLKQYCRSIEVSDYLHKNTNPDQYKAGLDLEDFIVRRDPVYGWALADENYPLFWDI